MKLIFRTTLLLSFVALITSCGANKDLAYKDFYKSINKQYSNGESFNYVAAPVDKQKATCTSCCGGDCPEVQGYIDSIFKNLAAADKAADEIAKKPCLVDPKTKTPIEVAKK